jgi:hypothetical protein
VLDILGVMAGDYGGKASMCWWLSVEFICMVSQSPICLKSLTWGGVLNADPSPGNRKVSNCT